MNDEKAGQESLDLGNGAGGVVSVEKYEFAPIKGYPMLNWRGKRPFTSTQFFPAQLKEVHGPEVDGWRNKIFWGDNLQVMSHLLKEFRGKVDLIYIDPPFDSKADYKKSVQLKGKTAGGDSSAFEEKQYSDIWSNDEYLQFIYERLVLSKELLATTGSIYFHCDSHKVHYVKCMMDEIFGIENFLNDIVWKRTGSHNSANRYGPIHDTILFYRKSEDYKWNAITTPYDEEYEKRFSYSEHDGRKFQPISLIAAGVRSGSTGKAWRGIDVTSKGNHWRTTIEKLDDLDARGEIFWPPAGGFPRLKSYLDKSRGAPIQDIWTDIPAINSQAKEREGYPTQKPEALVARVVEASSKPGDLVFDFFMGSGTTQVAAMRLGRRFIGADINLGAVQTTTKRLVNVSDELIQNLPDSETPCYTGFEVHNVNQYDIFRNPVQAKELLLEVLEVQKLEMSTVFDGEKDGRMIKIMPVNRIATRADLNELIAGFDYKAWERRQAENPNRPVEKVTLVCMGHDPSLRAELELSARPYKIDVQVVDILRDKANLEFRRDSEARVVIKGGELVIERFYPMNLLQKLSMQKEAVDDWRELVESILIDWNYDGAVLQPAVVDIPAEEADLVTGRYKVPADAGTIRIKITDLLSESWEGGVTHG